MPMIKQAKNKTSSMSASPMSSLMTSLKEAASSRANSRPTPAPVHSINQRQLINMTRYRNIIRYQLGRPLGKPLIADNMNSTNLSTIENKTAPNNKTSSTLDGGDVADISPTNQKRKTRAKRKTRSITSSSSPIFNKQDQDREERHCEHHKIKIGRIPTDSVDNQGGGESNEYDKLDSIHHNQSLMKEEGEKRDIAMENFSKFSAPASGA